ncbi:MAG: type III pantothenate kinase, partial [Blastocatellia bacterium]
LEELSTKAAVTLKSFWLTIKYDPITSVGTDRLINAFAAVTKYGKPIIACSFGTATTIDAVNENCEFLGGIIAPGMATLAESLHLKTAKLPRVEIAKPKQVIGSSTESSIMSGIFYGYVGLVEGLISRLGVELGDKAKVIATGGFARLIAPEVHAISIVDENLTLDGLRLVAERK